MVFGCLLCEWILPRWVHLKNEMKMVIWVKILYLGAECQHNLGSAFAVGMNSSSDYPYYYYDIDISWTWNFIHFNKKLNPMSDQINASDCQKAHDVICDQYAQTVRIASLGLQIVQFLLFLPLAFEYKRKRVVLHGNLKVLFLNGINFYNFKFSVCLCEFGSCLSIQSVWVFIGRIQEFSTWM